MKTDKLYSKYIENIKDFTFDEQVAEVFSDMAVRSIPGYREIIKGTAELSKYYASEHSSLYDLGCSLGDVLLSIDKVLDVKNVKLIGIDNSPSMCTKCKLHISNFKTSNDILIINEDIQLSNITNASVVILNFTLQFLKPSVRDELIQKIFNSLIPGGVLILSEKFKFESPSINQILTLLHHDFKKQNGYSDLEISQKRNAIENIMKTDTKNQHYTRLTKAGFSNIEIWYNNLNFGSFLAIK